MRVETVGRACFVILIALWVGNHAIARQWAKDMFEVLEHDFQTVARGTETHFDFVFQNKYVEDVHIAEVRTSCGCTTPTVLNDTVKTWEKSAIRTKFNTRSFLGEKTATITVVIDKPFAAEVQLSVKGFVRQDVVLTPGSVQLGEIDAGDNSSQRVKVDYAGRDDWQILKVETPRDYYRVKLRESRRGGGRVGYEMVVQITGDAPIGHTQDELVMVTNDAKMERIPFTVEGRILPSVTVSPASLALGVLRPGQRVTQKLLVKAKQEFEVTNVRCDGDCLSFENPNGAKRLHFIPVTFTAGDEPGNLAMNIYIETSLGRGATAQCKATASVRDPAEQ